MIIPFLYSGKPNDDYPDEGGQIILTKDKPLPDEDGNDKGLDYSFHTATEGKNSDDYKLELAFLVSKKEKLMEEIGNYELELPRMEKYRLELEHHLKELQEGVDLLRHTEDSAKKDLKDLENEYESQKKEIENMGIERKDLKERLQKLKIQVEHEKEKENWKRLYDNAKKEYRH